MKQTKSIIILFAILLLAGCSNFSATEPTTIHYQGTGDVIEYHANGKIKAKSIFVQGQLTSTITYFTSGTKDCEQTFHDNQLHFETCYFASGEVKRKVIPVKLTEE